MRRPGRTVVRHAPGVRRSPAHSGLARPGRLVGAGGRHVLRPVPGHRPGRRGLPVPGHRGVHRAVRSTGRGLLALRGVRLLGRSTRTTGRGHGLWRLSAHRAGGGRSGRGLPARLGREAGRRGVSRRALGRGGLGRGGLGRGSRVRGRGDRFRGRRRRAGRRSSRSRRGAPGSGALRNRLAHRGDGGVLGTDHGRCGTPGRHGRGAAVGQGADRARGGVRDRRPEVQRTARGRRRGGRGRCGGRRRHGVRRRRGVRRGSGGFRGFGVPYAREVDRAGVTAGDLVRSRLVDGLDDGLRGGRGHLVAPCTLGAGQQQILVLGGRLGEVGVRTVRGDARLFHHACALRQPLARDLAGVGHAYPSPIGFVLLRPVHPERRADRPAVKNEHPRPAARTARPEKATKPLSGILAVLRPPRQRDPRQPLVDCATLRALPVLPYRTHPTSGELSGH
ncbi:hypothetical protein STXM2123_5498 [Streptomyces sp. F-3]|nr:hypothetical protein STXM2123_5498 [Streptomyces sp. F-3]